MSLWTRDINFYQKEAINTEKGVQQKTIKKRQNFHFYSLSKKNLYRCKGELIWLSKICEFIFDNFILKQTKKREPRT